MSHYIEKVTVSLENLISELARNPSLFLKNPDTDFSRNRKINFKTCVGITMNSGGCTLNKELLDFFDFDVNAPTVSAYTQQRAKILPEAFEYLFHAFTEENAQTKNLYEGYQLLACDGSNLTIAPNLNDPETLWKSNQLGATGNHLHLNALYDVLNRTYIDALVQTASTYQEHRAYPIVFIGYSISDSDIQEILGDVVECLPPEKVNSLQKRFIFIDYQKDTNDCEVSSHSLVINGKLIEMTKIILSDFGILYDALSAKKAALPVKLLRRFKDELYSFALTQQPGPTMQVAALDDGRIDENMLALSIGLASTGVYGLARAVNSEQWYRNIILHDSMYSCDKLLEYVYPELAKQNSWKLPVWYYIANSDYKSSLAESKAPHSYNDIVSEDSIKRNRTAIAGRTAMEIWTQEKTNVFKAIRLLGFLPEDKIDVEQYQQILETIFKENANILSSSNTSDRSSLKRMIRIYDFLLYRQKKTP